MTHYPHTHQAITGNRIFEASRHEDILNALRLVLGTSSYEEMEAHATISPLGEAVGILHFSNADIEVTTMNFMTYTMTVRFLGSGSEITPDIPLPSLRTRLYEAIHQNVLNV